MSDPVDWSLTSWDGNRLRQHREFLALSFREKLEVMEELSEVAAFFAERRRARGLPVWERARGEGGA